MAHQSTRTSAAPNATREWVEQQLLASDLAGLRRLTSSVHRKYPTEDRDIVLSWVGEQIAVWCDRDTLAPYLADGSLTHGRLKNWLKRRFGTHMYRLGCEPVERQRGLRSEVERVASLSAGRSTRTISGTASQSGGWEVAPEYTDMDDTLVTQVVVSQAPTPEDVVSLREDTEAALAEARRLVEATFRDAGPRYQRIFEYIFVDGLDRHEIAEIEGCSKNRASQLSTRVRNAVRQGGIIRSDADRLLSYLSGREDTAVWEEIKTTLRIDAPRFSRAVAYLGQKGVGIERDQDVAGRSCYHLTR